MTDGGHDNAIDVSELKAAQAEFEHRLRQLNDIVERSGGAFGSIDQELKQVRLNLNETKKALKKATTQ